jgi:hypothetical protein
VEPRRFPRLHGRVRQPRRGVRVRRQVSGRQGTLDRYIRDYGGSPERRGILHFYNIKIDLLAPDAAMLVGQYRLIRGPRVTEGVNTRLFRKIHGHWLITMNHVSAYDVAPSASAPAGR